MKKDIYNFFFERVYSTVDAMLFMCLASYWAIVSPGISSYILGGVVFLLAFVVMPRGPRASESLEVEK